MVATAALLMLAGCQTAARDTSADEAVIRKSAPAWAAAYNAGDVDRLAAMYWDDAVLQPPGAPAAVGRTAIRKFLAADSAATRGAGLTMNIPEAGAVDVSGDLAYEAGTLHRDRCIRCHGRRRQVHRRVPEARREVAVHP